MSVPSEFSKSYVESNSPVEEQLYTHFLKSRDSHWTQQLLVRQGRHLVSI
jgi:hypothetical protein